jgi:signal transduction histidine kinase
MFRSIRRQWTLTFIGLAITPLLLTALVISSASFRAQEERALALQHEVTRRISAQITALVGQIENEMGQLIRVGDFTELSAHDQGQRLSELLSYEDGLESISLVDVRGHERARVERMRHVPELELGDWSQTGEFHQPSTTGEIFYGSLIYDDATGEPLMNIAYPLNSLRTDDLVEGVLIGQMRIKKVWDLLRDGDIEWSEEIYIVDQRDRIVAHASPSVVLRGTTFTLPGEPGITTGLNEEQVVMAWETIQFGEQTLFIVAEQPVSQALALAYHTLNVTVALLLVALIVSGLAGTLAVRQIVRPIETLADTAQEIAAGDLSKQVSVDSSIEIMALASSFNTMTAQLGTTLEGLEVLNADLERRVAERTADLKAANLRLTELDRLKTQFIRDMSHELRTPLSVLNTTLYLLERKPERQAEYTQKLKDQLARLTRLTTSAFDLSRLDQELTDVDFAPVSLNEVVSEVAIALSPRAESAGLEFVVNQDAQLGTVYGARNLLMTVVTNLVANAIAYTPNGSVEVTTTAAADRACLLVCDTGRGITPEDMPHVFERFYRGAGVGSSTISGSGLGLAMVKQIVDLHQGSVEVESQVDEGTTFRVWLPLANGNTAHG